MEVGIVARKESPEAVSVALAVHEAVYDHGDTAWVDETTAASLADDDDAPAVRARDVDALTDCALAVAIGGDGTFLFAARNAGATPVLGVNLGEVGFLNAVPPASATQAVSTVLDQAQTGEIHVRQAPRLTAQAAGWESVPAANEIVVQGDRRGPKSGIEYELRVDGSLYSTGHGDGVLVATPTGSTAYNLSERGPLVAPNVQGVIVNEMGSQDGMPPLVVDIDATVTVSVAGSEGATVVSDGRHTTSLEGPVTVQVERTAPPMQIAGPKGSFFEALEKLS